MSVFQSEGDDGLTAAERRECARRYSRATARKKLTPGERQVLTEWRKSQIAKAKSKRNV